VPDDSADDNVLAQFMVDLSDAGDTCRRHLGEVATILDAPAPK
jgi:hypothetical protein